jgi:hypothetical protein
MIKGYPEVRLSKGGKENIEKWKYQDQAPPSLHLGNKYLLGCFIFILFFVKASNYYVFVWFSCLKNSDFKMQLSAC